MGNINEVAAKRHYDDACTRYFQDKGIAEEKEYALWREAWREKRRREKEEEFQKKFSDVSLIK